MEVEAQHITIADMFGVFGAMNQSGPVLNILA